MANTIYITTAASRCGKSLVSLGIMELLLRKTQRVGIFRPIINPHAAHQRDKIINLILSHFKLDIPYEACYAFLRPDVDELIGHGKYDEMMNKIIERYKALESQCDFMLCVGSDVSDEGSALEFELNADIAQNLGCPVLILGRAMPDNDSTISLIKMAIDTFLEKECQVVGTIVNRAEPHQVTDLMAALNHNLSHYHQFVSVIPINDLLNSPTIQEVADYLEADVLYGANQLSRQAFRYLVVAMQIQNYLPRLSKNALLITPGDRGDVILSALQAHESQNYPQLAGLLLTGGLKPAPALITLLDGLPKLLPILFVTDDTYEIVNKIGKIRSYITSDNQSKISLSLKFFETYVNTEALEQHISNLKTRGITPRMFQYNLVEQAKTAKQHIVLPEGTDARILKAAEILLDQNIVDLTLIGDAARIETAVRHHAHRLDLDQLSIVEPEKSPQFIHYVETLHALRQHRGLTLEQAKDLMLDVSYFGTMMVYQGQADGMVSGAVHTTQHTIRPALQFVKTKPGISIVSSVFFMCLDDRVLVYGDCAINPNPTAEQLSEIAISSAKTSHDFGLEPRIAMLSYSSGSSGKGEEVEKVRAATELVRQKRPDLNIEGPIQYDAAVDMSVAAKKMPDSQVAGQATVLIFPDLNTGNNTYKAVQRETGAIAMGPILQGLNKPVNDLSRGCTVEDIVNTVVITAIQGQG